jgi:hypothetical protein
MRKKESDLDSAFANKIKESSEFVLWLLSRTKGFAIRVTNSVSSDTVDLRTRFQTTELRVASGGGRPRYTLLLHTLAGRVNRRGIRTPFSG